jgi:hypothetical protein
MFLISYCGNSWPDLDTDDIARAIANDREDLMTQAGSYSSAVGCLSFVALDVVLALISRTPFLTIHWSN